MRRHHGYGMAGALVIAAAMMLGTGCGAEDGADGNSCTVAQGDDGVTVDITALGRVTIRPGMVPEVLNPATIDTIGIRPEMLTILSNDAEPAERSARGSVTGTSYYGDMTYYTVQLAGGGDPVTISMRNTAGRSVLPSGSPVTVGWGAESVVLFE